MADSEKSKEIRLSKDSPENELGKALRIMTEGNIGVLDNQFLCQSVSVLNPKPPICVAEDESLENVLTRFNTNNISSVLVLDEAGKVCGIFTERDCIRKVVASYPEGKNKPVRDFMTRDPVVQLPDISMAYALNLMSHGGFRHIPLVDKDGTPIGIVSIRDVMDHIVSTLMDDLMNFPILES